MMWIYIIKFPLLNHSKKHQFVTDFTSFVVIDEPSEPQTPKADKKPEQKPDEKTSEEKEHEIEDKKDSVEKKFMKDLNNQFSKKKSQPITATQKPVDLKQKTQKAVPKTPTAKKIITPSKKSNTGAVFGDPHFMIFDKSEVPFCFNYQPKALSSMITLVRDPKSKYIRHDGAFGDDQFGDFEGTAYLPGNTLWWQGFTAGYVDFTNDLAAQWWRDRLELLRYLLYHTGCSN